MKTRALNQRGYAQLQSGVPLAELINNPDFSVEVTEDMVVRQVPASMLSAADPSFSAAPAHTPATPAAQPPAEVSAAELSAQVTSLTASLADLTVQVEGYKAAAAKAATDLAALNAAMAEQTAAHNDTVTKMSASIAALKPIASAGIRLTQIRAGSQPGEFATATVESMEKAFSDALGLLNKLPAGPVSVVSSESGDSQPPQNQVLNLPGDYFKPKSR